MKIILKYLLVGLALFICSFQLKAQNLKPWLEYSLSHKFTKNVKAGFSQIYSFNTAPFEVGFAQTDFSATYRIKKRTNLQVGYIWAWFKDSPSMRTTYNVTPNFLGLLDDFSRVYASYSQKHRFLVKRLWLKHTASVQLFFPKLAKYGQRFTYSAKLYYKIKHFPMNGVPYLENKFFVYLGGIPTDYYDSNGSVIATNSTNGFHRYRLKLGVSLKPFDFPLSISPYIFYQRELNFFSDLHALNTVDPTGKIINKFNNYTVLGVRLAYNLK